MYFSAVYVMHWLWHYSKCYNGLAWMKGDNKKERIKKKKWEVL